ncbi:hypothetical protein CC86DRAFT_403285 [Ophiobolus disseminans]|uniref:DUF7779 domain-containing protein n=1 Tax=Ophiobolus disseminans TaxID=1469910 RepID=A0A6A7AAR5_9PLEO|nr:hypothetical protein CC86DRAFT_403285 [Ophiobolus disseminans]
MALPEAWNSMLASLDPPSAKLLSVLSLMDPDSIPDRLFSGWKSDAPRLNDPSTPDEHEYITARTPLLDYGMIEVEENISTLRRIVQSTRLKLISAEERSDAFEYLWEIGQYDDAFTRVDHAETICSETIGLQTPEAARLFVVRGSVLLTLNRYSEAGGLFKKGLDICVALLPWNDQLLTNSFMQVGNFYLSEDRFDNAIEMQTKVIAIREASDDSSPAMMVISHFNLSRSHLGARRFEDAERALSDASRCATALTSETEKLFYESARLYVLGNISLAKGDLDATLRMHTNALEVKEEAKCPQFSVSASKHKLGDMSAMLADYNSAQMYLREAIVVLEKVPGHSGAKLMRIARTEKRLSEVLLMSRDAESPKTLRANVAQRLQTATEMSFEEAQAADFGKLVPHLDR